MITLEKLKELIKDNNEYLVDCVRDRESITSYEPIEDKTNEEILDYIDNMETNDIDEAVIFDSGYKCGFESAIYEIEKLLNGETK